MAIINNPFNGRLNLDVADYRISNGDYIDAVNIIYNTIKFNNR